MSRIPGTGGLSIGTITMTDPTQPFNIDSDGCSNQVVDPQKSCKIIYRFSPTEVGDFDGNSSIPSNAPANNPALIISKEPARWARCRRSTWSRLPTIPPSRPAPTMRPRPSSGSSRTRSRPSRSSFRRAVILWPSPAKDQGQNGCDRTRPVHVHVEEGPVAERGGGRDGLLEDGGDPSGQTFVESEVFSLTVKRLRRWAPPRSLP